MCELKLIAAGVETSLLEAVDAARVDLRFGSDDAGEIYILSKADGKVRTLMPAPLAAQALGSSALSLCLLLRIRTTRTRSKPTVSTSWEETQHPARPEKQSQSL